LVSLLLDLIGQYGIAFVFLCVMLEQAGIPFPAYPVLLVAGSLAAAGQQSVTLLLLAAVLACLVSDIFWYLAGQRHGGRVLGVLCKLSLTPDGCVRQTESIFARWGPRSLVLAKFVPGFASVATAMAGSTGVALLPFVIYDAIGASLWAGVGLLLGWVFAAAVEDVLLVLEQMGRWGLLLVAVLLAAFIASKLWRRYQFRSQLRMDRITVQDLSDLQARGLAPVLVDVRSALAQGGERISGAIVLTDGEWPAQFEAPHRDALVVVYCACPNEVSAALVAQRLMKRGYKRVLPLKGGIDAWRDAGLALDHAAPAL
jgi:membrane protein DedA with SNARE-associated domain/rhodanese-related sulfurtransferase